MVGCAGREGHYLGAWVHAVRVLVVGGGAREHCIAQTLFNSGAEIYAAASTPNPGLAKLCSSSDRFLERHESEQVDEIVDWARKHQIDLAVIGLEDGLAGDAPLTNELRKAGIPTVGPNREAAQLETSKLFTRLTMEQFDIPGRVEYYHFIDSVAVREFLLATDREWAIKPVGLTAGKGVRIMDGDQLVTPADAADYAASVIADGIGGNQGVVIEERLVGEEFTLQCFVSDETIIPMPLVQDYKRAYDGDHGPNTGSMGSYSQENGLLPFVDSALRDEALDILERIVLAVRTMGDEYEYRGILYGQFMLTARGLRLVEINARFGDPEAINVLPLLKSNFVEICHRIADGKLSAEHVRFANRATVCKYIAPPGYPDNPAKDVPIHVDRDGINRLGVQVFLAKVTGSEIEDQYLTTRSRSIALVAVADSVDAAEAAVQEACEKYVTGADLRFRSDIGKQELRDLSRRKLTALSV